VLSGMEPVVEKLGAAGDRTYSLPAGSTWLTGVSFATRVAPAP